MAEDKEFLRENWEGKLPVLFRLSENDQFIREDCEPLLLSVRRQSYFPIILHEKANKYFKKFLAPDCSMTDSWMEYQNGEKVQWHWPIGVLFDLHCLSNKTVQLPWIIKVNYTDFPKNDLIPFPNHDSIKSFFMSSIKEADFLKYRGQNINSMKPDDVTSLYENMMKENFEKFWSVNQQLMRFSVSHDPKEIYKNVPLKIHFCNNKITQTLINPLDTTGKSHTLFDLFEKVFFPSLTSKNSLVQQCGVNLKKLTIHSENTKNKKNKNVAEEGEGEQKVEDKGEGELEEQKHLDASEPPSQPIQEPTTENTIETTKEKEEGNNDKETSTCEGATSGVGDSELTKSIRAIRFLIHGISPSLSTPIQWMYDYLSYSDNFVHICVADMV